MSNMRAMAARALLVGCLVATVAACDSSDGDDDARADVVAWCEQLEMTIGASAALEDLNRDDPGFADALARLQDATAALSDLEAPSAIASDWETVAGPVPTNEAGAFEVGGEFADAGKRIGAWALDECDLSSSARSALEQQQNS